MSAGIVRRTEVRDAPALARLHAELIPGSLWAELGHGFLRALYEALAADTRFVSFVYEDGATLGAFLAASTDTSAMLRATALRHALTLTWAALPELRPALVRRLGETGRYPGVRGGAGAESFFCAVRPELRRRGIAGRLHDALESELRARSIDRLIVTREAANEIAAAHLASRGFAETGRFRFYGKDMVRHERAI